MHAIPPPPAHWRSEAFAEDLLDVDVARQPGSGKPAADALSAALLGAVPLLLAAAGALTSAWAGTA